MSIWLGSHHSASDGSCKSVRKVLLSSNYMSLGDIYEVNHSAGTLVWLILSNQSAEIQEICSFIIMAAVTWCWPYRFGALFLDDIINTVHCQHIRNKTWPIFCPLFSPTTLCFNPSGSICTSWQTFWYFSIVTETPLHHRTPIIKPLNDFCIYSSL